MKTLTARSTNPKLESYHNFAQELVKKAGRKALEQKKAGFKVFKKSDGTKCTSADPAVERFLRSAIEKEFPGHGIVGEELGIKNGGLDNEHAWLMDPIDGTGEFIRDGENWSVQLALAVSGTPVVGIVFNPVKDQLISSFDGEVFVNGIAVEVIEDTDMSEVNIRGFLSPKIHQDVLDAIEQMGEEKVVGSVEGQAGSPAFGFAGLALGEYQVYVMGCRRDPAPEDFAAGICIVRDLGGIVTDEKGGEVDPFVFSKFIIASATSNIHAHFLEMLAQRVA